MPNGLSAWWDSVELWLAQAWFPVQFLLVALVLTPVCLLAAWVIDRAVSAVAGRSGARARRDSAEVPVAAGVAEAARGDRDADVVR